MSEPTNDEYKNLPQEQWETWGKLCLNLTNRRGYAISEKSKCPRCLEVNFHLHFHAEALECMNPQCKTRYPSGVPRPASPGETTEEDFRTALDVLFKAAKETEGQLRPLTKVDYDAMTPAVKAFVARACVSNTTSSLAKVLAVADQLAEKRL